MARDRFARNTPGGILGMSPPPFPVSIVRFGSEWHAGVPAVPEVPYGNHRVPRRGDEGRQVRSADARLTSDVTTGSRRPRDLLTRLPYPKSAPGPSHVSPGPAHVCLGPRHIGRCHANQSDVGVALPSRRVHVCCSLSLHVASVRCMGLPYVARRVTAPLSLPRRIGASVRRCIVASMHRRAE